MEILSFQLKGQTAFFKKPDVNSNVYFTYGNIHRVALMGLLGAIIGLSGYGCIREKQNKELPEFYQKLDKLQIGIEPKSQCGTFSRKIQTFNNSVGYASQELGGNLIVKEQWLEEPSWNIYVVLNDEMSKMLAEKLLNNQCVYTPYLGKNDHLADISNARVLSAEELDKVSVINSLFVKNNAILSTAEEDDGSFMYEENLPVELLKNGMYKTEKLVHTDFLVESYDGKVYGADDKVIAII